MNSLASSTLSVWDDYDAQDAFLHLLTGAGLTVARDTGDKIVFSIGRNKNAATFYRSGKYARRLFVNESGTVFETGKGYSPTDVYALIQHGGNRSAACKVLYAEGFGDRISANDSMPNDYAKIPPGGIIKGQNDANRPVASPLSPEHQQHLAASAIAPEQLARRGYETVQNPARLRSLGFSRPQAENVPGLLVPYRDTAGVMFYQFRPDRRKPDGAKYETPPGRPGRFGLDVPEGCREEAMNGAGELWITEGAKKADAAVSAGLCCVSLPGVWMFLRENEQGRKALLPDFDRLNLAGRDVVVCYDSDAMTKSGVYVALRRLSNGLRQRGAIVRYCYLPDDGETKTGLDDFLAQGQTVADLRALCEERLRPIANAPAQALIDTLNRACVGVATFRPKRVQVAGDAGNEGALKALKAVYGQQVAFDDECRFFYGDLCNRLDIRHGDKGKLLEKAIGAANAKTVYNWARVCTVFSGERDYFRDAMPMTLLRHLTGSTYEVQDAILSEYLQAQESGQHMTQEELRRLRDDLAGLPHDAPGEKGERVPVTPGTNAPGLHAIISAMRPESQTRYMAIREQHGLAFAETLVTQLLPDALDWLIGQAEARVVEDEPPAYVYDNSKTPASSMIYRRENEETPESEEPEVLETQTAPDYAKIPPGGQIKGQNLSKPEISETSATMAPPVAPALSVVTYEAWECADPEERDIPYERGGDKRGIAEPAPETYSFAPTSPEPLPDDPPVAPLLAALDRGELPDDRRAIPNSLEPDNGETGFSEVTRFAVYVGSQAKLYRQGRDVPARRKAFAELLLCQAAWLAFPDRPGAPPDVAFDGRNSVT